jgi:regulator of protease activity HflC (stomatin/prohibitin superfamily)
VDFDDDLDSWPRSVQNTLFNVCPQGKKMVIERLGKLHEIKEGGWFLAIPIVDQIRFVVDMREKALNIPPQSAITKDNVHVHVSGNLYCQFVDAEKAAYGSKNPIYAVKQHAQSSMRAAIGELELDEILHARAKLNEMIKATVQESAKAWGLEIKRYEITTVSPDKFITEAMDKQAAAERHRRKKVLDAEGDKRAAELESEGVKIRMKNESEGTLIKMTNEAEAKKIKMLLEVILLSISHNISTINFLVIPMMSSTPGRGRSKGDRNARFGSSNSHQSNSRGIEGRSCI